MSKDSEAGSGVWCEQRLSSCWLIVLLSHAVLCHCPLLPSFQWSVCSQACGGGFQNRSIVCRMPHDDIHHGLEVKDSSLCPPPGVGDSGDGVGHPGVEAVSATLHAHVTRR